MAQRLGACCSRLWLGVVLATAALAWMPAPASGQTLWHAGNFRKLPTLPVTVPPAPTNLVGLVTGLPHPNSGAYGTLSASRTTKFQIFVDGLFAAIDDSIADGNTGDWCGVKAKAADAGYEIFRYRDAPSGRWLVYGRDKTTFGQAYFVINPYAKRNIVIEVPHEGYDTGTAEQGARIFLELAARALIINKEHRCSDPHATTCSGTTGPCNNSKPLRESDVAHDERNTFHLLHRAFSDGDTATKFVQLHGFDGSATTDKAEIADGTTTDLNLGSVSVLFASKLATYVPELDVVRSCQEAADGSPPSGRCATTNVQGRYTHGSANECTANAPANTNRFLHVEQAIELRDNDPSDGYWYGDVRDALRDTWPTCNMNNGPTDCTLGGSQTNYSTLSCP